MSLWGIAKFIDRGPFIRGSSACFVHTIAASSTDGRTIFIATDQAKSGGSDGIVVLYNQGTELAKFPVFLDQGSTSSKLWYGIACSADASFIIAGASDFTIYRSINSGTDWSQTVISYLGTGQTLESICCSSTGQIVYILSNRGFIYKSSDYGQTWGTSPLANFSGSSVTFIRIACSANGQVVVATAIDGISYSKLSTDGSTFTNITSLGTNIAPCCSVSADGTCLAIAVNGTGAGMWVSRNTGTSWTNLASTMDPLTTYTFQEVGLSSNGNTLAAGATDGTFFLGTYQNSVWSFNNQIVLDTAREEPVDYYGLSISYSGNQIAFGYRNNNGVFTYGIASSELSLNDATSYVPLSHVTGFDYNQVIIPNANTVQKGRLLTFFKYDTSPTTNYIIQTADSNFTHILTSPQGFVTLAAGPSNWLRLGATDLYGIQDFNISYFSTQTIQSPATVNTIYANFSTVATTEFPLQSTHRIFVSTAYISSLTPSSLYFTTNSRYPLYASSSTLLYKGENIAIDTRWEILQTLTF